MPLNYKQIGKNIQNRRKQLHVTQQKMADDLYLSASLISKLERGIKPVSMDTFCQIAEYLNTSLAALLSQSNDTNTGRSAIITEINSILDDLEQPHLYMVNQLMRTYYDSLTNLAEKYPSNDNDNNENSTD